MSAIALSAPRVAARADGPLLAGGFLLAGGLWLAAAGTAMVIVGLCLAGAVLVLLAAWRVGPMLLWIGVLASQLAVPGLIALVAAEAGHVAVSTWLALVGCWLVAILAVSRLSALPILSPSLQRMRDIAVVAMFGAWVLIWWQTLVVGFAVPLILLPAPSAIWTKVVANYPILAADFRQTFLKAVLAGYALGSSLGFLAAIAADRVPFLRRGMLPVANLVSALPIIGVAPIMVMWFGFDWTSKAAVVTIMTFFPMLVSTLAGLSASDAMERDLMRTYAAGYWQSMFKLRLPAALPFIFTALKINTTLALIGAIVAEFFGTPIVGMGFRISIEVGRMHLDTVWAEIAVAALAGSAFYGIVAIVERAATFWHPSFRQS
jgi:NitT/TauT family transport system permease protein